MVSCMPCKSDGGVNAVKLVFWQGDRWTYSCCNWFCTVTLICTNRKKHTSFSTEHKLCKSAIVFLGTLKKVNNGQNNNSR